MREKNNENANLEEDINTSDFEKRLQDSKASAKKELREKIKNAKLALVKEELRKSNISFDDDIDNLKDLKKSLKKELSDYDYDKVLSFVDTVNDKLDKTLEDLEKGSTSAFTKLVKELGTLTAKTTGVSLAAGAAVALAPTVGSKIAVSTALTARSIYKISNSKKSGSIMNQETEIDRMLEELEVTYKDDKIVDTRFNDDTQQEIREYLQEKSIDFDDTGYLSLRTAIHSLSFDDKLELCNLLNNRLGRGLEVKSRVDKRKKSLFGSVKNLTKPVAASTAALVGAAGVVNSVEPAIIAGPLNGTALGLTLSKFCDSKLVAGAIGTAGGFGSAFLKYIPVVGEGLENVMAVENILAAGIVGVGVGTGLYCAKGVYNTVRNLHNNFKYSKDKKELLKFDGEKYKEDNALEYQRMLEFVKTKENTLAEQAIFDLLYDHMSNDLNISFAEKPENIRQLNAAIRKLPNAQKEKVSAFVNKMKDCNNNNHSEFVNGLITAGKIAGTLSILGLSGLSVANILKDGTLIPEISSKLFGDVPNNIYLMDPTKADISSIDVADKIINNGDLSDVENLEKAQGTMHTLNEMQVEENIVEKVGTEIGIKTEEGWNSTGEAVGDFLENPGEKTKEWWQGAKDWLSDAGEWIADAWNDPRGAGEDIAEWGKGVLESVTDKADAVSKTFEYNETTQSYMSADTARITETINNLGIEELTDLSYLYNNGIDIYDPVTRTAIGNALQSRISETTEFINEYNEIQKMIKDTSDFAEKAAEITTAIGEISEVEGIKKSK